MESKNKSLGVAVTIKEAIDNTIQNYSTTDEQMNQGPKHISFSLWAIANNEPCALEEKAQLKELLREYSIIFANLFTEHELPIFMQRELMLSRNKLYEYLNQKGVFKWY